MTDLNIPSIALLFSALVTNRLIARDNRQRTTSKNDDADPRKLSEFVISQKDFHDLPSQETLQAKECECGLERQKYLKFKCGESTTTELVKSFTPHQRHLFVYSGMRSTEWNSKQEKEGVALLLQDEIKRQAKSAKVKVGLLEWPSDGQRDPLDDDTFDVLVLPDGIIYRGLNQDMLADFVDAQIVNDRIFDRVPSERTSGTHHVFVCSHLKRDSRCGLIGPLIFKSMVDKTSALGLPVQVHRTSHVGGHKYAGNVIIFRHDAEKDTYTGDWYGYVNDSTDVDTLIEKHIVGGKIVPELWRGRCALPPGVTAQEFLDQEMQRQAEQY